MKISTIVFIENSKKGDPHYVLAVVELCMAEMLHSTDKKLEDIVINTDSDLHKGVMAIRITGDTL